MSACLILNITHYDGEYVIHTAFLLKEDTSWAEAGFEVAFGEHIFAEGIKEFSISEDQVTVAQGDYNVGVHGKHFSAIFGKTGTLVSLKYHGKEMITQPIKPIFWRALTDNDRGNNFAFEHSAWYAASIGQQLLEFNVEAKETYATIRFDYALSIHQDAKISLLYTVYGDGKIKVESIYQGVKGLPNMPINGVTFKLSADYEQLEWYARGPEENYQDRCHGARLGVFRNRVSENVENYVIPQETGNRTGVRRVDITNDQGLGVRISAVQHPVQCSILPYTAFELENAYHPQELPNVHHTVVTVAGQNMGVGGDDSWGAPVHEEFRINAEGKLRYEFFIEPIRK